MYQVVISVFINRITGDISSASIVVNEARELSDADEDIMYLGASIST